METFDALDLKILALLDEDARLPISSIARKLSISRQLANIRLKRMEANGLILGHYTIFDSGVLGLNWYRALIRLQNVSKQDRSAFIGYLKAHPNVVWLGEVGGRWDVGVNFACNGHAAFNAIHEEIAEKFGRFVNEIQILVYVDVYDFTRTYLDPERETRKSFFHKMAPEPSFSIDDADRRLIQSLASDARLTYSELSEKTGLSRTAVKRRISRLMKHDVILGYRTFPRLGKIGFSSHMVFLQMHKMNKERESELYIYLRMLKQVTFVVKHLEAWRIGLEIETKDEQEFQEVLLSIRSHFSDIISDYDAFPLLQDHVVDYFPKGALATHETPGTS